MPACEQVQKSKKHYSYIRKTFTFDGLRYEVCGVTIDDVIQKKLEKIRELEAGRADSNSTVKQWATVWLKNYVRPRPITEKSYRMYESIVSRVIIPELGRLKLRQVTDLRLQQLLNGRAGQSYSSVIKLRMVLKAMFRQAWTSRLIVFDPSASLSMPRTEKGSHRSLTASERHALLTVADMPSFGGKPNRSGAWVLSMLYCGLRPAETAALRWSDIDLDTATLHVRHAIESGSRKIKEPKTSAGVRDIPIPRVYLPWLQNLKRSSEYVFTQRNGSALSEESIKRRWETIKKYMDLELGAEHEYIKLEGGRRKTLVVHRHALSDDLDLYCLRHTYCTDLEKKGVPLNVAKVLMGHSDISVTANIYTHHDEETTEAARALIDA